MVKTAELTQEHEDRQGNFCFRRSGSALANARSAALAKRAEYLKEKNRIMMRKAGTRQMEAAMEQGNQAMKTREATLAAKYLKENQQALTEKKSKAEDEDWVMVDGMEDWEILRGLKALELSSSSQ